VIATPTLLNQEKSKSVKSPFIPKLKPAYDVLPFIIRINQPVLIN